MYDLGAALSRYACVVWLVVAACGGGSSGSGASTGGTAGGTGDGSSGAPPTGSGATDTGSSEHAICDDYLACVAAALPDTLADNEANFGPEGGCWLGPPEIVEQCLATCEQGLASYGKLFPDEPACGGPGEATTGATDGGTSEGVTTGPDCTDQPSFGESCARCPCYKDFMCDPDSRICGECVDGGDCPGGVCVAGDQGGGNHCNAEPGGACADDSECTDAQIPYCTPLFDNLADYATCSECLTDANCPAQAPICTPVYDLGNEMGTHVCKAPGTVPQDGACPLTKPGNSVCVSGLCAQASYNGIQLGICSTCRVDNDCGDFGFCHKADADEQSGKLTGGYCL